MSPRLYRTTKRAAPRRLGKHRLDRLVEEAIIDAYGESEQRVGLLSMLQMNLACPFVTEVLGTAVSVERIDLNAADEIVAVCRRGRQRQLIPILDLRLLSPRPAGWEWIEAFRHWRRRGANCEAAGLLESRRWIDRSNSGTFGGWRPRPSKRGRARRRTAS